jgi:phosphatidylglycerol:prolipoprotein diacylglycerol transferase
MHHWVHNLDPVLVHFGSLQIRWYGLMYLVGYTVGYFILMNRFKKALNILNDEGNQTLITYIMVGMILGARLTYVVVYNPMYYMHHLSEIPAVWQGGLSFHGAALGYIVAVIMFSRKYRIEFFHLMDNIVVGASMGIVFGRIGNFINGELFGRTTDVPWGIIFPEGGPLPRHPSQLYQALGEGLCVFLLLLLVQKREQRLGMAPDLKKLEAANPKAKKLNIEWKRTGVMGSWFLILYGIARFIVEFFREPDSQLGFFWVYFSMGQILCFIQILAGIIILYWITKNPRPQTYQYELK